MKISKLIFAIVLFTSVFSSCELFDSEKELEVTNETISGKWMVTNTSSGYQSFEFIDGGICIVVENSLMKSVNDETVRVGSFVINDQGEGIVVLFEFGDTRTLDDIRLTGESASFTITDPANPDNVVNVVSERAEEISSSDKTKLLARSWVLWRLEYRDLENMRSYNVEIPSGYREVVALSISGTYTVFIINDGTETRKYGNWMWLDDSEEDFRAWHNDQFSGDARHYQIMSVSENALWLYSKPPQLDGNAEVRAYKIEPSGYYW